MKKQKQQEQKKYVIEVTEKQLIVLNQTCNSYMRLICGQSMDLVDLMENAWEKRCKRATGNAMDEHWEGGWSNARAEAEAYAQNIRSRFWNCAPNTQNGLRYDDTADILYDLHQVFRNRLYKDMPKEEREQAKWTVMADPPMQFGSEPLAEVSLYNLCDNSENEEESDGEGDVSEAQ